MAPTRVHRLDRQGPASFANGTSTRRSAALLDAIPHLRTHRRNDTAVFPFPPAAIARIFGGTSVRRSIA
jgi:hypothetical protein